MVDLSSALDAYARILEQDPARPISVLIEVEQRAPVPGPNGDLEEKVRALANSRGWTYVKPTHIEGTDPHIYVSEDTQIRYRDQTISDAAHPEGVKRYTATMKKSMPGLIDPAIGGPPLLEITITLSGDELRMLSELPSVQDVHVSRMNERYRLSGANSTVNISYDTVHSLDNRRVIEIERTVPSIALPDRASLPRLYPLLASPSTDELTAAALSLLGVKASTLSELNGFIVESFARLDIPASDLLPGTYAQLQAYGAAHH